MQKLEWHETEVQLKDLKEFNKNPRYINKDQFNRLVKSLKENGYNTRILVDTDNTIIGGHMRLKVFKEAGFNNNDSIKVLIPNRKLTEKEFERINIQDNIGFGEWDVDLLANYFEIDELIDWGINENLFKDLTIEQITEEKKEKSLEIYEKLALEIEFPSELELEEAFYKFTNEGYKCKILTL